MSDLQWSTDKPEHDMHSCLTCRKKYNAKDALLRELVDALRDIKDRIEVLRDRQPHEIDILRIVDEATRRAHAAMKGSTSEPKGKSNV